MEQDIFDRIKLKNFKDLSESERIEIGEFCNSETEFNEYKAFLLSVERMNAEEFSSDEMEPSENVKSKLDDLFASSFPVEKTKNSKRSLWKMIYPTDKVIWMRPLVQVAALFILFLGLIPLLVNNQLKNTTPQLAQNEAESQKDNLTLKKLENSIDSSRDKVNKQDAVLEIQKEDYTLPQAEKPSPIISSSNNLARFNQSADEAEYSPVKDMKIATEARGNQNPAAKVWNSNQTDGVFNGYMSSLENNYSISAGEQSELLDLLTASF